MYKQDLLKTPLCQFTEKARLTTIFFTFVCRVPTDNLNIAYVLEYVVMTKCMVHVLC